MMMTAITNRPYAKYSTFSIASICLLLFLVTTGTTCVDDGSGGEKPTITSRDHIIGDDNAPVTVVEYGDFQCPVCGRFDRDDWADIKANYVDTGKARFVFRQFPLRSIHDHAQDVAEAAECAGDQVDFFDFKSMVYEDQAALFPSPSLSDDDLRAMLAEFVSDLGGSDATFTSCAGGGSKTDRVQEDVDSGLALGVSATPTFFVNDEKVTGYRTADQLGAIIDQHVND